jgi:AraC-like DNA-binding protein
VSTLDRSHESISFGVIVKLEEPGMTAKEIKRYSMTETADSFATIIGHPSVVDCAFPVLPFSSRETNQQQVRNVVDERFGEGTRHVSGLSGDLRIMAADFSFREEVSGPGVGHDYLKFHYKLSGRNIVRFANRPDTLIETGRSIIAYHPEGLYKDDCYAAGVREVSVTIGCRRHAILDLLQLSSDELPKPARRYFDCPDSDFICDELPLTARMREALSDMNRPNFSPWLGQIYIESKVLDLICLSLHELTESSSFGVANATLRSRDIEMLRAVRRSLETSIGENITISALCRKFATNRTKLSQGFYMVFGETIFEYIHKLRMEHAKLLLTDTDSPISEIADRVGYARQSSFSTAFREYHGIRPLDIRRSNMRRF